MMPGTSVPSGSINFTPRLRAHATTMRVPTVERKAAWMSGGISGKSELDGDLVETPAQAERDRERGGSRVERPGRRKDVVLHHAARQWVQMPEISITGDFGVKPAARAADVSVEVTSADDASPTMPQRSQIRNTTSAPAA